MPDIDRFTPELDSEKLISQVKEGAREGTINGVITQYALEAWIMETSQRFLNLTFGLIALVCLVVFAVLYGMNMRRYNNKREVEREENGTDNVSK